jgi:hypothetical protein
MVRRRRQTAVISGLAAVCALVACSTRSNEQTGVVEVLEVPQQRCVFQDRTFTPLEDGREPAHTDTILTILLREPGIDQADRVASGRWIVAHEHFLFGGERYFLAHRGLLPNQFRTTRDTLIRVGEHDSVTLYARRRPEAADTLVTLFVRTEGGFPCGIWQYLHVSEVRN